MPDSANFINAFLKIILCVLRAMYILFVGIVYSNKTRELIMIRILKRGVIFKEENFHQFGKRYEYATCILGYK